MGAFEYLLLLAAVILGLAVTDLAVSAHRLLSAGRRVRWDALTPLAAALAFERILVQWWTWHSAADLARGLTFGMFALVLVSATLLFLMCATALPDEVGEAALDLRVYYASTQRRFWLLFAAQWTAWTAVSIWAQVSLRGARLTFASPVYLIPLVALVLAFWRARWVQAAGLVGFIALFAVVFGGRALA